MQKKFDILLNFERPFNTWDGSVRPQTLGKRVSDDPRHFIFRHREKKIGKIFDENFSSKNFRQKIDKLPVFEELWLFGRNRQMRLEKMTPEVLIFSSLRLLAEG